MFGILGFFLFFLFFGFLLILIVLLGFSHFFFNIVSSFRSLFSNETTMKKTTKMPKTKKTDDKSFFDKSKAEDVDYVEIK